MGITVFLADDHAVVRDGLGFMLDAQTDITVVGVAKNGRDAIHQVRQLSPHIVIMDIAMPELNGIEATREISTLCRAVQVIILSMYSNDDHVFRSLEAGARGYLLKESAGSEVVTAVRAVYAGHRYLSQKIGDNLVDDYIRQCQSGITQSPLDLLSSREREVMQLVVEGHSSADIADILYLSPKTVETYRSRLMQKLDIRDLPNLVKFAIQQNLTSLD